MDDWIIVEQKKKNKKCRENVKCINCSKKLEDSFIEYCKNCKERYCLDCRRERNKYFFCSDWCRDI